MEARKTGKLALKKDKADARSVVGVMCRLSPLTLLGSQSPPFGDSLGEAFVSARSRPQPPLFSQFHAACAPS